MSRSWNLSESLFPKTFLRKRTSGVNTKLRPASGGVSPARHVRSVVRGPRSVAGHFIETPPSGCRGRLAVVFLFALTLGAIASTNNAMYSERPVPMIVTLRPETGMDKLLKDHGLQAHCTYHHALNGFAASLAPGQAQRLRADPRVLAVERDGQVRLCAQTNGTGIIRMGIPTFPVAHINGQDHRINVDVAVLDTGIQTNHPDLNVVQAVGFSDPGLGGNDWDGHGTHVAGIIGALDNNFGVVGVAPGARLWAVQVFGPTQHSWSNMLAGLDYIAMNADKIEIVNVSLDSTDISQPYIALEQAVASIVSRGVVFVAAAGNGGGDIAGPDGVWGTSDDVLPAALPEVMAVSAMNPTNDQIASFSDFSGQGSKPFPPGCSSCVVTSAIPGVPLYGIEVCGPGVAIYSTWINSGYAILSGTSMASPHAAGLVALYIAANGRAHTIQDVFAIRQAIVNSSQPESQWSPPNQAYTYYGPLIYPSGAWIPSPNILSQGMRSGTFQINFAAVPGYTYTAQYAPSLVSPRQWTPLGSTNGEGSVAPATLTDLAPNPVTRFYRLVRTPSP
ncbi:MAG: hypothetical protein C5B50_00130 [Verrucomicrobia bacterium]|nr:MAG: hypothetical protein C5B50_00130 [Verrucomicrobiota bacterium]